MRFLVDDERFGLLVTPLAGRGMFRFQVIMNGRTIGDTDPCILGTAMGELEDFPHLDDARLGRYSSDPAAVFSIMRADEYLHDVATLTLAESLDRWLFHGYVYEGRAVLLARACFDGAATGEILTASVDEAEFAAVVDAARTYWLRTKDVTR